jgi:hypothetical protein
MLRKTLKWESIFDPAPFFPKALNISLYGRSSDLSRFHEAFPSAGWRTVAGISQNHHRINDRASQQRVLLRILTAFPFHCNDNISLQHQNNTKIIVFIIGCLKQQSQILTVINNCWIISCLNGSAGITYHKFRCYVYLSPEFSFS